MSANSIIVGSSSESEIGVGNLMKWDADKVTVDYDRNREEGAWRVVEKDSGNTFFCYSIMQLEADLEAAGIEESDIEHMMAG